MILFLTLVSIPVEANREVYITSTNLNILNGFPSATYDSSGRMFWYYCRLRYGAIVPPCYGGRYLDVNYKKSLSGCSYSSDSGVSSGCTQVADNNGYYWGQCVSLCKALSKINRVTDDWIKGRKVVNGGVSQGAVIATFSANSGTKFLSGSDHCAILKRYIKDSAGKITGIEVWDQNWGWKYLVKKHTISRYGSGVTDADNYYVLNIP